MLYTQSAQTLPMPLDVYHNVPVINLQFVNSYNNKISLLFHIDICAAMSKFNLLLH